MRDAGAGVTLVRALAYATAAGAVEYVRLLKAMPTRSGRSVAIDAQFFDLHTMTHRAARATPLEEADRAAWETGGACPLELYGDEGLYDIVWPRGWDQEGSG